MRVSALLLAFLLPAAPVAAAPVFDNGGIVPTNNTWNASEGFAAADDFLLAGRTRITDITFSFFSTTMSVGGEVSILRDDLVTPVAAPISDSGAVTVANGLGTANANAPTG